MTVLKSLLGISKIESNVQHKVKEHRNQIKAFATQVTMIYEGQEEQVIMIGEDWTRVAGGVHSILCSLNGEDCTVMNVLFSEGGELKRHKHPQKEIVFVAQGSVVETVENKEYKQGDSVILDPGQLHGWKSNGAKLTVVFDK